MATQTRTPPAGRPRGSRYRPPPPDTPLAECERQAFEPIVRVAAASLETLPPHSLLRRVLTPLLHELDMHYSDPRSAHQPLGGEWQDAPQ